MPQYQALKGMRDILPEEIPQWQILESRSRHYFEAHGFEEIRTPLLEPTELFSRSIGEGSDIVHKQMYTFEDRGGRTVTLRPEMTASVVRAAIEGGMLRSNRTTRLYYLGPMFRAERPQRGRQRQFHQLGAEILNAKGPGTDVEMMSLAHGLLAFLNIPHFLLNHNYLGSESECRAYGGVLRGYFSKLKDRLCKDCQYRIDKNVLRVLDCKVPACQPLIQEAPELKLGADSDREYSEIRKLLDEKKIETHRQPRLVRGLDYYSGLVFEIVAEGDLGAQDAVAAGGRYDGLVASLGGPEMGATGFAAGIERILLAQAKEGPAPDSAVYVATLDARPATQKCFQSVLETLYQIGKRVKREPVLGSLADHLKKASKLGIRYMVIIGEQEIASQSLTVKDLEAKKQEGVPVDRLAAFLLEKR